MSSMFRRGRRAALAAANAVPAEPARPVLAVVPPPPPPSRANPDLIGYIEEPPTVSAPLSSGEGVLAPEAVHQLGARVESWPTADQALVERMRTVRPGLTVEQAHTALHALRTLGLLPVAPGAEAAPERCRAIGTALYGAELACTLAPHDEDDWHQDPRGTKWRERDTGSSTIHAAGQ